MAQRLLCALGGLSISVAAIYPVVNKPKSLRPSDETEKKIKVNEAIEESRKLINRLKNEVGAPGIVVGVSIDGEVVWKEGLGYADLENEVEANEETVMRIASISKSLTAAVVARLWQDGVIDIDKPVQTYVPTFPEKKFGNEKVTITTRHLMCHLSGIRHYSKKRKEDETGSGDGQHEEFYSKERYDSVEKALSIFKDDELLYAPGSKFLYTTYGWTLVSAVMEGATGKTYPQIMRAFLRELGMRRTWLDQHEPIIYGRSKCYSKNKNGRVVNSPYVDNSCKWAGGGFLSTVGDLLKFSNALLFAFQRDGDVEIAKDSYKMIQQKSLNSESALEMKDETITTNDSNLQQSTSVIGYQKASNTSGGGSINSGVGSIASGVMYGASSVWNYGSSWLSKDENESKAVGENKANESAETVKDSKSVLQKTTSVIGSGVDSDSKAAGENKANESAETEKESKSVLQKTTLVIGSEVDSDSKAAGENKANESAETDKESKLVLKKTTSVIGSGVGSIASGVMYGASSVWNYGSSWLSKDKNNSKAVGENEANESAETVKGSKSGLLKTTSVIGSGVDSDSKAASENKANESAETDKDSKSVLQRTSSVIGSGVDSVTSGVMYGASSVRNNISSWFSRDESDSKAETDKDKNKSLLSSLSSWFKPKALSEIEVIRTAHENKKEQGIPETSLTGVFFWNGIVIPYAVGAVRGRLSSRVFTKSVEEELEESVEDQFTSESSSCVINSPFFFNTLDRAPYILPTTVAKLWTRVEGTRLSDWGPHVQGGYGLGFGVASPIDSAGGVLDGGQPYIIGHTGGAVGASSAMVIVPRKCNNDDPPKGIAVVLLCNMQSVSLNPLAIDIAKLFSLV